MNEYVLLPGARSDLRGIWDYTQRQWSIAQADRYVGKLSGIFVDLSSGAKVGRPVNEIRNGYFKYLIDSHVIYHRWTTEGQLEIVRILHQRMDAEAHL